MPPKKEVKPSQAALYLPYESMHPCKWVHLQKHWIGPDDSSRRRLPLRHRQFWTWIQARGAAWSRCPCSRQHKVFRSCWRTSRPLGSLETSVSSEEAQET